MSTPAVLVHPMWFGGAYWDPCLAALAPEPVSAPDLPGFGNAPGPFTAAAAIASVVAAQEAAGAPVDLVGLSLGARVALAVAAAHPDRVRSLMLLGIGGDVSDFQSRLQSFALRFAGKAAAAQVGGEPCVLACRQAARAQPQLPIRANAARIQVPTLVVAGGADAEFRDSCRAAAAAIEQATFREIADAQHLWPRERPQEFASLFLEWRATVA